MSVKNIKLIELQSFFQNPMESFLKYISSISQRLTCSVHQGNKIPFLEIHFRTRLCTILFNLEKKGSNSPTDNQYAHHSYPFSRYKNSDTTTRWCRVQLCYILSKASEILFDFAGRIVWMKWCNAINERLEFW